VTAIDPLYPLVDAALEGDDAALAELVRQTQADIWRLCTVLGSPGEEEDLVQETFLRAFGSIGTYRGDSAVRPWLLAIARNVCADHVRRRTRQRRILRRVTANTTEMASGPPGTTEALLAYLDDDRREAFVLTQMLGHSYEDAAVVLGCPIGTVRSRVSRARAELRELIRRSDAV